MPSVGAMVYVVWFVALRHNITLDTLDIISLYSHSAFHKLVSFINLDDDLDLHCPGAVAVGLVSVNLSSEVKCFKPPNCIQIAAFHTPKFLVAYGRCHSCMKP